MGKLTPQDVQSVVDGLLAHLQTVRPTPLKVEKPVLRKGGTYDEEQFVLLLSDLQAGHKTKTFNFAVLRERMARLVQAVDKITAIHRKAHPVRVLNIFLLGDLIQNEASWFVSLDELEAEVKKQLFDVVIPLLLETITHFASEFSEVKVFCVRGNHGSNGKLAATNTNWDDVAYRFLELSFRGVQHVHFTISDNFFLMARVLRTNFLLAHGDQIPTGSYGIPLYGAVQRLMRWQGSIGVFDVMTIGHFHNFAVMDWNNLQLVCNGTFVSDDAWVQKNLGLKGSCAQTLLSVHPKVGVSFVRRISLDKK
jgi:predicted phosphodiesterase